MTDRFEIENVAAPLRLLVISYMYPRPTSPVGGIFVHEQVKALIAAGVDVQVVSGEPFPVAAGNPARLARGVGAYISSEPDVATHEGVPVAYFRWPVGRWAPIAAHAWAYEHGFSRLLRRWLKGRPFDIIHAHTSWLDGSAGVIAARETGAPLVITEHTAPFDFLTRNLLRRHKTMAAMRKAARIFAVSAPLRAEMIRRLGPAAERVEVLGNGVDPDVFRPRSLQKPQRMARGIWVGHHVRRKRVDRLLAALAMARKSEPDLTLSLLGEGELLAAAQAQAAALGLTGAVTFLPATGRAGVAAAIADHDYLVISSEAETFGVVALEAMACGRPVLTTACGGPEDVVSDDSLGLVVENGERGLAVGLVEMSKRAALFDPAGIRAHVERASTWPHIAKRLIAVYREELARRS